MSRFDRASEMKSWLELMNKAKARIEELERENRQLRADLEGATAISAMTLRATRAKERERLRERKRMDVKCQHELGCRLHLAAMFEDYAEQCLEKGATAQRDVALHIAEQLRTLEDER